MSFDRLDYVMAIAEEQNMTKAAARLFISQPALTASINKLEEELGVDTSRRAIYERNEPHPSASVQSQSTAFFLCKKKAPVHNWNRKRTEPVLASYFITHPSGITS